MIGVYGAEREVLCRDAHLGKHIEQGALADVGKANNANLQQPA